MSLKARMSLDEFLEFAKGKPEVFFNAAQRGYAALSSYGRTDGTWNFIRLQPNDRRRINNLWGLDQQIDTFMTILKSATQSPQERSKLNLFIGPTASGKSESEKIIGETLKVYGEKTNDLYMLKANVDDGSLEAVKDLFPSRLKFEEFRTEMRSTFGNFKKVFLAPGLAPHTALSVFLGSQYPQISQKLDEVISEINNATSESWKKIYIDFGSESSSATWTKSSIETILEKTLGDLDANRETVQEILMRLVSIERASENEIASVVKPSIALGEKNLDYKAVFGGDTDYGLLGLLNGNNNNPLVLGAGVAGGQNKPSPRGGIIVFSEVLKAPESFKSPALDLIQDRMTRFKSYKESFDAIFLGTTNLDEYSQLGSTLKDYFMGRTNALLFKSMTKLSSAEQALKNMFEESAGKLKFHYSSKFLKTLAYIWVMSGLDEETNISPKQKAELYDGKKVLGLTITSEELEKKANSKTLLEITEGVKRGIPYREMQKSITKFIDYARSVQSKLYGKRAEEEELCLDAVFGGEKQTEWLEMFLNTMEGISEETKVRVHGEKGKALMNLAFDVYSNGTGEDVANCYTADNAVREHISRYVLHKYQEKLGRETFPYNGRMVKTDKKFIADLEKEGRLNAGDIATTISNRIRERYDGKVDDTVLAEIAQAIIETNPNLVKGLITLMRPDINFKTNLARETVQRKLKEKYGYCDRKGGCADVAYGLFESTR